MVVGVWTMSEMETTENESKSLATTRIPKLKHTMKEKRKMSNLRKMQICQALASGKETEEETLKECLDSKEEQLKLETKKHKKAESESKSLEERPLHTLNASAGRFSRGETSCTSRSRQHWVKLLPHLWKHNSYCTRLMNRIFNPSSQWQARGCIPLMRIFWNCKGAVVSWDTCRCKRVSTKVSCWWC